MKTLKIFLVALVLGLFTISCTENSDIAEDIQNYDTSATGGVSDKGDNPG